MAKWVRHFFRGNKTGDFISAPAYKGIALVKINTGLWSVMHVKTGSVRDLQRRKRDMMTRALGGQR